MKDTMMVKIKIYCLLLAMTSTLACTEQLADSFRFQQEEEVFSTSQEINTKIDLLWVVDNSASMDVSQKKLRNAFESFALKYMKPTWDIRVAVITTDTYLAHTSFNTFRNTTIPGTTGYHSNYIFGRIGTWVNPSWNPTLVNPANGNFTNGIKYKELFPLLASNYSRLLPGIHDGPTTAICFELLPYFYLGVTQCSIRDNQIAYSGTGSCLNPGGGEDSVSQCVNTIENDTVRSGKAILETMPPAGQTGNAAWTQQLIDDFTINVTTGSSGYGSERGLASLRQVITDNEGTSSAFFRKNSLRGIIFVTDEDDQSVDIPTAVPAGYNPWTYYKCDQASLLAMNAATPAKITGMNGYCCNVGGNNCTYGSEGLTCPSKTVEGYTYTPSVCPRDDKLIAVSTYKTQLDTFFNTLDGTSVTQPGYFIVTITPLTAAAIQSLQTQRDTNDVTVGSVVNHAVDRGDRYLELGNLVGNGSLSLNIADNDYTPILNAIGNAVIEKKGKFKLVREPTGEEDMIVEIVHADGSHTAVDKSLFVIQDDYLIMTDIDFILSLASSDKILINYQPIK